MVAASNDPSKNRRKDDVASIADAAIKKVLNSKIYLYEATDALTQSGIAGVAIAGWASHLGSDDLIELCFKVRASVEDGKTPAECDHVAIELYKGGSYLGAAWVYFDRKTLAGQPLTDTQIDFLEQFITVNKPERVE